MHTHRRKNIRVQLGHHGCHGTARRQTSNVHAVRVNLNVAMVGGKDLARQRGNHAGLAAGRLMGGLKPVPAIATVGFGQLFGVQHHDLLLVGKQVHPGALGKVQRVLLAAVKQHHQWQGLRRTRGRCVRWRQAGRNIQAVSVRLALEMKGAFCKSSWPPHWSRWRCNGSRRCLCGHRGRR